MIPRFDRRALAVVVIGAWVVGLVLLARRRHGATPAELLATGALRIAPMTYYYVVLQDGRPVGGAASILDTSATGFRSRELVRARALIAGDSETVVATSTAYLSRGFALDSFAMSMGGDIPPLRIRGAPRAGAGVLLPTLAPIAMMVTREPRVGDSSDWWVYNPVSRRAERMTLKIAAESLMTIVDSAAFDRTDHVWLAAHSDTVRSWKLVVPSGGLSAWVDSHGRIVTAREPGGASLVRTAYQLARQTPQRLPQ